MGDDVLVIYHREDTNLQLFLSVANKFRVIGLFFNINVNYTQVANIVSQSVL